jgi:hypothetical protein
MLRKSIFIILFIICTPFDFAAIFALPFTAIVSLLIWFIKGAKEDDWFTYLVYPIEWIAYLPYQLTKIK